MHIQVFGRWKSTGKKGILKVDKYLRKTIKASRLNCHYHDLHTQTIKANVEAVRNFSGSHLPYHNFNVA